LFPKARREQAIPDIAEEWAWIGGYIAWRKRKPTANYRGRWGFEPDDVGETLQAEGLQLFIEAYEKLLASVQGSKSEI